MQINRDLGPLELQDFRIGLDLLGQVVHLRLIRRGRELGADFSLARAQRLHQDIVGILILFLRLERVGAIQGLARFPISAAREGKGQKNHHRPAAKTALHVKGH